MMLAGVPVTADSTAELAGIVRAAGADLLADRLEKALADEVKLLALSIGRAGDHPPPARDPPDGLTELRAVLLNEHQWRQRTGLDP